MNIETDQRLERIERIQAAILLKLNQLTTAPRPNLSRRQFAERAGLSVWTVSRKIRAGEITTVRGRIPASELARYTSAPPAPAAAA